MDGIVVFILFIIDFARNLTQLYVRLFIYVNYLLCIQPDFWN